MTGRVMASSLPSYQEATARPHWLDLVAPYVAFRDYPALCLVDHRCWNTFAPRLWGNLLRSVRRAGLDPGDDLAWWFDFVFARLATMRHATRLLVRVLDFRDFAKDVCDFDSDDAQKSLLHSVQHTLGMLTKADSIILDGHANLDPGLLMGPANTVHPLLLSVRRCVHQLPNTFFNTPSLQRIIYLDITGIPGSIVPLIQPSILPELRILKICDKEVDDVALMSLVSLYRLRLWSLDVSDNKVSDKTVDLLATKCFPTTRLHSEAHFQVEGKLVLEDKGTLKHGPFFWLEESECSGSFSHPERYYVDAPIYLARSDQGPQEYQAIRSDGRRPIRQDSADNASYVLSEGDDMAREDFRVSRGLTHVHVSNTNISAAGVQKLIRISNGQIEQLSCDSMPLLPPSGDYTAAWPASASLRGILGAAHVFRPVLSPNLRVLRIHHSLVTHIPKLELSGASTLARTHMSENIIAPRVDDAFGKQAWVPDMNPRLTSLTLTGVPRRSSGPLAQRLIMFLRRLSEQERAIRDVSLVAPSWRGPDMLKGLRHLRLEFEPDPIMEDGGLSTSGGFDAEELMDGGGPGFSFFDDEWSGVVPVARKPRSEMRDSTNSSDFGEVDGRHLASYSVREDEDYVIYHNEWNGEAFTLKVWIGSALDSSSAPVLRDYRRLVVQHGIRDGVGPVTPAQVGAGAPPRSYIFHTTWYLAVMPRQLDAPPRSQLVGMKDVLQELKRYRLEGRALYSELKQRTEPRSVPLGEPHYFWTGNLEVSMEEETAAQKVRLPQYWR